MNVFQCKERNRNRDPIQLFHSIERNIQYVPLCIEDRAPLRPTEPYFCYKEKKWEEVCFHLGHSTVWQPQWKECRFRALQPIGNTHTGSDPGDGCLVTRLHFLVWFVVSSYHRINWHCSIYSISLLFVNFCLSHSTPGQLHSLSLPLCFCSYSLLYGLFWLVIAKLPLFPASFAVALILWLLPLFISLSMNLCSPFPL